MLHKKAADVVAAVALALVVLTLGVRANDARAETAELTDAQMDKITAGAWTRGAGFDLVDSFGIYYRFVSTGPGTGYYLDTNNAQWNIVGTVYFLSNNHAFGVLITPNQVLWDGGYSFGQELYR